MVTVGSVVFTLVSVVIVVDDVVIAVLLSLAVGRGDVARLVKSDGVDAAKERLQLKPTYPKKS